MRKMLRCGILGVACLFALVVSAEAGGLYLYEIGSPDVGLAAAGYAARAADASTVFTNPAGMTRLKRPSWQSAARCKCPSFRTDRSPLAGR